MGPLEAMQASRIETDSREQPTERRLAKTLYPTKIVIYRISSKMEETVWRQPSAHEIVLHRYELPSLTEESWQSGKSHTSRTPWRECRGRLETSMALRRQFDWKQLGCKWGELPKKGFNQEGSNCSTPRVLDRPLWLIARFNRPAQFYNV